MANVVITGQLGGLGKRVVGHRGGPQLSVDVVKRHLIECLRQSLRDSAMKLASNDQRVDDIANIVHRIGLTGLGVTVPSSPYQGSWLALGIA